MADTDRVTAAVMIIGDEILSGRTQDTNLNFIARLLSTHGVDVAEARVVPDIEDEIVDALNLLRKKYDYVITTGGIGPTHDDITADSVAKAFGLPLHEHPEILEIMTRRWGQGVELTPARRRMARVPEGGSLVRNSVQGPPGFQVQNVFVLAGVPSVMRGMMEDVVTKLRTGVPVTARTVRVDGAGEGVIAEPLANLAKAHPNLALGSYPFFGQEGYGSNLVIRGRDAAEVEATVEELIAALAGIGAKSIARVEG